jgi:hypothetical protein
MFHFQDQRHQSSQNYLPFRSALLEFGNNISQLGLPSESDNQTVQQFEYTQPSPLSKVDLDLTI